MNTLQIERMLKTDSCAKTVFKGVFFLRICFLLLSTLGVILSTLIQASSSGEHWVAMFFKDEGSGEYFDSYGLHPIIHALQDFMDSCS